MKSALIISILVFHAIGCSTAPKHVNPNLTMEQAQKELGDCLNRNTMRLDDKMSDASTVARGAVSACFSECENVKWSIAKNKSGQVRNMIMRDENQKFNRMFEDKALVYVLKNRQ